MLLLGNGELIQTINNVSTSFRLQLPDNGAYLIEVEMLEKYRNPNAGNGIGYYLNFRRDIPEQPILFKAGMDSHTDRSIKRFYTEVRGERIYKCTNMYQPYFNIKVYKR